MQIPTDKYICIEFKKLLYERIFTIKELFKN